MKTKPLRIERFLNEMNQVVPWKQLEKVIQPHYKSTGGRPPHELLVMLRFHFLQLWHNLSDPLLEEALYDRLSFQTFLGFDCFGGVIPDESSICRFRHLLEAHGLSQEILDAVNAHLDSHGLVLKAGTIVDATLLAAPVSKQYIRKERDPEMSSTRRTTNGILGPKGILACKRKGSPLFIRPNLQRPKSMTASCWTSCNTAKNKRCSATARIPSKRTNIKPGRTGSITGSRTAATGTIPCLRL